MRKATGIFLIIMVLYCISGTILLINEQNVKRLVLRDSIIYHYHGNPDEFEDRFTLENNEQDLFVFYAHGVSNEIIAHVKYSFDNSTIYEQNITEKPHYAGGSLSLDLFTLETNETTNCSIEISVLKSDRWHITVYNDPPLKQVAFFEEDSYTIMMILLILIGGFVLLMIALFIEISRR